MWTRAKRLDPIACFYVVIAILLGICGVCAVLRDADPATALLSLGGAVALFGCAWLIESSLSRISGPRE